MNVEPAIASTTDIKTNQSFLLLHIDSDTTHAIFVKDVSGRLSILGGGAVPSTTRPPEANVILGVTDAIRQIEHQTGHHLITTEGDLVRNTRTTHSGIDQVLLSAATVDPWPVLVIAPTEKDNALSSLPRLLASFANKPPVIWTVENRLPLDEQVNAFLDLQPAIVLVVGEKDRKNVFSHFGEALRWAGQLLPDLARPSVIYAAEPSGLAVMEQSLAGGLVLHVTDDIRPQPRRERLNGARNLLADLIRERYIGPTSSMPELIRWSLAQPYLDLPKAARYVDFRAREIEGASLAVGMLQDGIWFVYATPEKSYSHIFPYAGLKVVRPDSPLLIDVEKALRWIPETDSQEHRDNLLVQLGQYAIWPDTFPEKQLDSLLWEAGIREILQVAIQEARTVWGLNDDSGLEVNELILGGTALRSIFPPQRLIHIVFDALQPVGVFKIFADRFAVLPSLGLLAEQNPRAATEIHLSEPLEELGTGICVVSGSRKAVTLSWQAVDGENQRVLNGDELQLIEISQVTGEGIQVKSSRRSNLPGVKGRELLLPVGADRYRQLYVDTRGRPLKLPGDDKKRQLALLKWQAGMGL